MVYGPPVPPIVVNCTATVGAFGTAVNAQRIASPNAIVPSANDDVTTLTGSVVLDDVLALVHVRLSA